MRFVTNAAIGSALAGVALVAALATLASPSRLRDAAPVPPVVVDQPATIRAVFGKRSYAPGDRAVLRVETDAGRVRIQILRAGGERALTRSDSVLNGVPVTRAVALRQQGGRAEVVLAGWPSGFYFARLTAAGGRLGYAPFVLRSRSFDRSRVAVVLPTNTWQAYNFRDGDGDGIGDTWYADRDISAVDLGRPYLHRGVPPHYRGYDLGFLRWLSQKHERADFLADDDLERLGARTLAALYRPRRLPGPRGVCDCTCVRRNRRLSERRWEPDVPLLE